VSIAALRSRAFKGWQAYWFTPEPAFALGLCRLLICGFYAYWYGFNPYYREHVLGWEDYYPTFWDPVGFISSGDGLIASVAVMSLLHTVWMVTLVLSSLGLFTRASTAVSLAIGSYLLWLPQNFGKVYHTELLPVAVLAILAFSRCGDALSFDRLRNRGAAAPPPSGEYCWPIRAVWLMMSMAFFAAGVSKLRHSGLAWVTTDNLSVYMVQNSYDREWPQPNDIALTVSHWKSLCKLLAVASLTIELGYPLAMFSRRARILVPAALGMQLSIMILVGPNFKSMMAVNVFWVPWYNVRTFLLNRFASFRARSSA
jgi:hypothetical protein